MNNCSIFTMGRAGIWYTDDITVKNTMIEAPKNFRRCHGVNLENVTFSDAAETLWECDNVTLSSVSAKGDYFAMNSQNMTVSGLKLTGNYSFDGCRNITVKDSVLLSKDAFWNCKNVTVENSFISGEYFGWNSENITLVNCIVESLQGFCFIKGLTMKNCKLINTTLAFEYSDVDAEITSHIDSVKNPSSGMIRAKSIGEFIMESDRIDPSKTTIITEEKQ